MSRPDLSLLHPPSESDLFAWLIKTRHRDLLTVREVCEITRLSDQSVRLLLKLGELDGFSFRVGGTRETARRISIASLCRYLLAAATLSESSRFEILNLFAEKLDTPAIDFLLPRLTARRARLASIPPETPPPTQ